MLMLSWVGGCGGVLGVVWPGSVYCGLVVVACSSRGVSVAMMMLSWTGGCGGVLGVIGPGVYCGLVVVVDCCDGFRSSRALRIASLIAVIKCGSMPSLLGRCLFFAEGVKVVRLLTVLLGCMGCGVVLSASKGGLSSKCESFGVVLLSLPVIVCINSRRIG